MPPTGASCMQLKVPTGSHTVRVSVTDELWGWACWVLPSYWLQRVLPFWVREGSSGFGDREAFLSPPAPDQLGRRRGGGAQKRLYFLATHASFQAKKNLLSGLVTGLPFQANDSTPPANDHSLHKEAGNTVQTGRQQFWGPRPVISTAENKPAWPSTGST